MSVIRKILLPLICVTALSGCMAGEVYDAFSDTPLDAVLAEVNVGDCFGTGCATLPVSSLSNAQGWYVFNPFGGLFAKLISPAEGEEAIALELSKSGYQSVVIYHRPSYFSQELAGTVYLATNAGKIYLCLASAVDSDGDSLCDDAEIHYGTDPNLRDTDGDGLSDTAEIYGYNGVDLKYFGANPLRKDILVELDYYPNLKPFEEAIQKVIDAFAGAPITNPDGSTGINFIVDLSDEIAEADADLNLSPVWPEFDLIKNQYFAARRAPIFHYGVFANQYSGTNSSGLSRGIPAHDFVVTLGSEWYQPGGTVQQQAGTLMHEFGHNAGLLHGGNDWRNHKPNYFSVMNYYYQIGGLIIDDEFGVLDFSRVWVDSVNEGNLNELTAMNPVLGSGTTEADLARYSVAVANGGLLSGNASENLDFNKDSILEESVALDLDRQGGANTVYSATENDWENLVYDGGGSIGDSHLGFAALRQQSLLVPVEQVEQCRSEFE